MDSLCWVKIANSHGLWWPGQKKEDGKVYFFTEDNTIDVEDKDILPYDCARKLDLIAKGTRRLKGENLENFKKDLAEVQKLCNDDVGIVEQPAKKAKTSDWKSIFAAPKPPPPPGSLIVASSPRKTRQRKKVRRSGDNKYCCDDCDFSTDRLNLFTTHRRIHGVVAGGGDSESPQVPEDKKEVKAKAEEILDDWKEEEEATEDFIKIQKPPPVCPMAAFDRLFAEKSQEPSEQPPPLHTFGTKQKAIGVVHPLEPEKESEKEGEGEEEATKVDKQGEDEKGEEEPTIANVTDEENNSVVASERGGGEKTSNEGGGEDENLVLVPVGNADGSVTLMVVQIDPDADMLLLLDQ